MRARLASRAGALATSASLLAWPSYTTQCDDQGAVKGSSTCTSTFDTLAPDVRAAALQHGNPPPADPWENQTLHQLRQGCIDGLAELAAHPTARKYIGMLASPVEAVEAIFADGRRTPLRIYRPPPASASSSASASHPASSSSSPPVIMFFHGGGFCICDPIENFDYVRALDCALPPLARTAFLATASTRSLCSLPFAPLHSSSQTPAGILCSAPLLTRSARSAGCTHLTRFAPPSNRQPSHTTTRCLSNPSTAPTTTGTKEHTAGSVTIGSTYSL